MKKTIIHLKDEINCKFENLDSYTIRKLVERYSCDIPGARFTPAVRLGRWDGKAKFFQLNSSSYVNLLPDILPFLEEHGWEFEIVDHRSNSRSFEFDPVDCNSLSHLFWPSWHQFAGQPIQLKDHQVRAINDYLVNLQGIGEISTSAGKTLITAVLSQKCEKYGRTVVIVPNKSLVEQTEKTYQLLGLDVGVYFGDRKDYNKTHTICTWQSLSILTGKSKKGLAEIDIKTYLKDVVCVMVDECQSVKAKNLVALMSGPFASVPIRWGLTGTVPKERYAQMYLYNCLGEVFTDIKAKELQDIGVLSKCDIAIRQYVDTKEFKTYQQELAYLVTDESRLKHLAKSIIEVAESNGNTLVLVDRIATGEILSDLIPESVFISGSVKGKTRNLEYASITNDSKKILIATSALAAVGIDIPHLRNVFLVEPGKSYVKTIQSIGRGLRKTQEKDHVMIYDITSTCKFSKRHLAKRKEFYREVNYPFSVEKVVW